MIRKFANCFLEHFENVCYSFPINLRGGVCMNGILDADLWRK